MDAAPEERLESVSGDGMPERTSEARLDVIKQELAQIISDAEADIWERRLHAEETRYCIWANQNTDGKKHHTKTVKAFPFDGASDARIRTADEIIKDRVRLKVAAASRFTPRAVGVESGDNQYGAKITALLRWIIKNRMRTEYRREIKKVADWQEADSPAIAVLGAFWHTEWALETKTVTVEELAGVMGELGEERGLDPAETLQAIGSFTTALMMPEMDADSAALVLMFIPEVSVARAKKIVKALRDEGKAEFPIPRLREQRPRIAAYRLFEDIWFPSCVGDIQEARMIVTREWMTRTKVEERILSMKWDKRFVEEVLEHPAKSFQPDYYRDLTTGTIMRGEYDRRDQYEILTAYYRATNEDGVPGIFMINFHCEAKIPAGPERILPYAHGKYPFTVFSGEITTSRFWDARGVPELVSTDQDAEKLLHDSSQDRTQLGTVPPIRVPLNRPPNLQLLIKPLGQIPGRANDYEWFPPPVNDGSNDNQQAAIKRRIDSYWARASKDSDPLRVQIAQQDLVDDFLDSLTETMTQVLQLCQQYMSDADLARVLNDRNLPMIRSNEEIQGAFDLILSFDSRDMDMEWLKKKLEIYKELISMDVNATLRKDKLVAWIAKDVDPWMAEDVVESLETSSAREIDDEQMSFAKIAAGVEPPMMENGQNFNLRLQWLQRQVQANPDSVRLMPAVSQEILKKRIEHFQFMVQQQQNAMIGRLGAAPVLGEQA